MRDWRWTQLLVAGLLLLGLAACGGEKAPDADEAAGEAESAELAEAPDTGEAMEEDVADEAPVEEAAESLPSPQPARRSLIEQGNRRATGLDEAVEKLPFTPLEPTSLPSGSHRTIVHLIEPIEGIENPALPAVRFIYDIDGARSLILVQAVAFDDLGEGDDVEVSGTPARIQVNGDSTVLTFERDGIHTEMRGSGLSREQLLELAESLQPYDQVRVEDASSEG